MAKHELTREGYDRLRAEHTELTTTRRVEISLWIERAREHGDIRENADYDAAKNTQGLNEARVRQLESMLNNAVVVEPSDSDEVRPGTVIEIEIDGDVEVYFVGSIEERHHGLDVLSPGSPLGSVLLGSRAGDVVSVDAPKGAFDVRVVSVGLPGA